MIGGNGECSPEPGFALAERSGDEPDELAETDQAYEVSAYENRKRAGLWTVLAALAVALAVMAGYGYSVMSESNARLAGQAALLFAASQRLEGLGTRLEAWKHQQDSLAAQLQGSDAGWKSAVRDAEQHSDASVAQAESSLRNQLNARSRVLESQIAQMVANQRVDQQRLAQLEEQLARTRQELASARQEAAREATALRLQQAENRRAIASIDSQLSTNEISFGIEKNRAAEIVPGISFHLTATDVRHQRFDGWIWFAPAKRTVWVRGQEARQPVVFYPDQGNSAYELVVTRIDQKKAVGFLLIPGQGAGAGEVTRASEN